MGVAQIGVALPNFWLGILLILAFAVLLPWFPAGGFAGWDKGVWPACRSLLLPALALALPQAAILSRVTRSAVLETLGQDYVRTALAKGLTAGAALWRHAVPQCIDPRCHHHGPAILVSAGRHGHHRECLHLARAWAADFPGDRPARPDRGAGSGGAARRQRHRGEFLRRPRLSRPSTHGFPGMAHDDARLQPQPPDRRRVDRADGGDGAGVAGLDPVPADPDRHPAQTGAADRRPTCSAAIRSGGTCCR